MFFSSRLSTASLIDLCRSMRHSLTSGLMLRDTMQLLADKGSGQVRPVAGQIGKELKSGWGLQDALRKQEDAFPPLFLALAAVGEESGNLPEVLGELEKYFLLQQQLRREFLNQITAPLIQFVAAVAIVALLIYVLGLVAVSQGRYVEPIDPLGLGLVGTRGALIFLGVVASAALVLVGSFWLLRRFLSGTVLVDWLLLGIPVLGPCLRALALTRFCVAAHLMLETNLSVLKVLRLAFQATNNAVFAGAAPRVEASLRRGNTIAASLRTTGVFPDRFLSAITVAEESGRLPEELRHQAEEFDEVARRRLALINQLASWLVWLLVACFIIATIFRIYTTVYLKNLEHYLPR